MTARVHIGSCAWSFDDWRGGFYPVHLPHLEWLKAYATQLPAVEVDSTFYHTPAAAVAEHWIACTPPEFVFTCKLPRELTHDLKLRDFERSLAHFLESIQPLRPKLGAVLVQLPTYFQPERDETALRNFLRALPADWRFAIEFRNPAWHKPRTVHLLEAHRICWAWCDTTPLHEQEKAVFNFLPLTTDFLYVRLLGDPATKFGRDGRRLHRYRSPLWSRKAAIESWALKIQRHLAEVERVFVFANNHYEGYAPQTCQRFADALGVPLEQPRVAHTGHTAAQLDLL